MMMVCTQVAAREMDEFRIQSEDSTAELAEVSKEVSQEVSKDDSKVLEPRPMEESQCHLLRRDTPRKSRFGGKKRAKNSIFTSLVLTSTRHTCRNVIQAARQI